jgi:hypothetical protein
MQRRQLVEWTSQAIDRLRREPFAESTWDAVSALADDILSSKANDYRGIALKNALADVQKAKLAMDAKRFADANAELEAADTHIVQKIRFKGALRGAFETLNKAVEHARTEYLAAAAQALEDTTSSQPAFAEAKAELERVTSILPADPVALRGLATLGSLEQAVAATSAKKYTAADGHLDVAARELATLGSDESPVPELKATLLKARQELNEIRPPPGEIYPIIAEGVRFIISDPLEPENLNTAEKLLGNVLALYADEPTAVAGLQAVEHLRITGTALTAGSQKEACAALRQAEAVLVNIGLAPSALNVAWELVGECNP